MFQGAQVKKYLIRHAGCDNETLTDSNIPALDQEVNNVSIIDVRMVSMCTLAFASST